MRGVESTRILHAVRKVYFLFLLFKVVRLGGHLPLSSSAAAGRLRRTDAVVAAALGAALVAVVAGGVQAQAVVGRR